MLKSDVPSRQTHPSLEIFYLFKFEFIIPINVFIFPKIGKFMNKNLEASLNFELETSLKKKKERLGRLGGKKLRERNGPFQKISYSYPLGPSDLLLITLAWDDCCAIVRTTFRRRSDKHFHKPKENFYKFKKKKKPDACVFKSVVSAHEKNFYTNFEIDDRSNVFRNLSPVTF